MAGAPTSGCGSGASSTSVLEIGTTSGSDMTSCGGTTVGKVSTDHQYKKFSSTDEEFFRTVGI